MSRDQIPTPDFETYNMEHRIASAELTTDVVEVIWRDGRKGRFHAIWLRDNDPSAHSIDSQSRERTFSLQDIALDIRPMAVGVSSQGGLKVDWSPDHSSVYHPGWLREFDYSNQCLPKETGESPCWGRELEDHLPVFSSAAVFDDEDVRYDFLTTLRRLGLAIVTDMPKDYAAFERISSQIGLLRDMNWGKIYEISPDTNKHYIASSGFALDAHNDAPTREYVPGFQIFQCVENTVKSGESFWVDGFHIAEIMRRDHPDAFEMLSSLPWEFANRARDSHYRWNAPVFDTDNHGNIQTIRDTNWLREPLRTEFDQVPAMYAAYKTYSQLKAQRKHQVERKLREGDVGFVDNRRVLHGRRAFIVNSGIRHLRTSYGEREELMSSIRMIERSRAARRACL